MIIKTAVRLTLFAFCVIFVMTGLQTDSNAQSKIRHKVAWQSKVGEEFQIFMMDLDNPSEQKQLTTGKNGSMHPTLPQKANRIYYYHLYPTSWGDGDQLFYIDFDEGKERLVQRNAIHFEDEPCVSSDGSMLAYRSKQTLEGEYDTENWEIICLRTDFSEARRVTYDIDDEMDPSLSGDGKRVYFTIEIVREKTETEKKALKEAAEKEDKEIDEESDEYLYKEFYYIYRNTFEGENLERITPRDYFAWHPSVSADEKWMAFSSNMDGNDEIYIMNLENFEIERITDSPGYDGKPYISSDGLTIVFVSDRDGDKEIFSMDRYGHNLVQLTDNDVEDDNPTIT